MTHKDKLALYFILIWLSIAFVCGLFSAFLTTRIAATQWVDYHIVIGIEFFSPLFIGMIAVLTVVRRRTYLFFYALGRGVCAWLGVYAYLLPGTLNSDAQANAYCATHECHFGGDGAGVFFLNIYLFYGIVLVLLGSGVTVLLVKALIKGPRRLRRTRKTTSPD